MRIIALPSYRMYRQHPAFKNSGQPCKYQPQLEFIVSYIVGGKETLGSIRFKVAHLVMHYSKAIIFISPVVGGDTERGEEAKGKHFELMNVHVCSQKLTLLGEAILGSGDGGINSTLTLLTSNHVMHHVCDYEEMVHQEKTLCDGGSTSYIVPSLSLVDPYH